ncbi:MAG: type I-C CRISPR-associated protein Cas8c/Csd1 [Thermomicrobiales bacterium]
MLLQRLSEYASRIPANEQLPSLYSRKAVRYIVELNMRGELLTSKLVPTDDSTVRELKYGAIMPVPEVTRSGKVLRPLLLADYADWTLGLADEKAAKAGNAAARFIAHRDLVRRCATYTNEPSVAAVATFLERDPLHEIEVPDNFDHTARVTFRVDLAVFPVSLASVAAFWAEVNDPDADPDKPAPVMQCIVCGEQRPVLRRLKKKIMGVPGAETGGAIISANEDAFLSYGLTASLISPICAEHAEKFTNAANWLLASKQHSVRLGGTAFLFWTREDVPFDGLSFLTRPMIQDVKNLLTSVKTGQMPTFSATPFYATALSASKGRIVIRDWIDTTVGEVQTILARWFDGQWIIGHAGGEAMPFGVEALALSMVRARKDLSSTVVRTLVRAALKGTPLPWSFLTQAMYRNQVETRQSAQGQHAAHPRAALIKLVLASHGKIKEGTLVQLEPDATFTSDRERVAYHCGRLLAALENLQEAAIPGVSVTVGDRYYGAAAANPAATFGRLLQGAVHHRTKAQRDNPGAAYRIQELLDEINTRFTYLPHAFSLEERGFFGLGFYHQVAALRAARREAGERRKARQMGTDVDESGNNA